MKIAITGHRPNKLGNDYDLTSPLIQNIKQAIIQILKDANYQATHPEGFKSDPLELISGMALGIDTLFAEIAIENNINLICAIPCLGQEDRWPHKSQNRYKKILSYPLAKHVFISDKYDLGVMQKRNEWMVDNCDILIAVWDGSSGGTGNCVKYAKKVGKPIIYIDPTKIINENR